MILPEYLPRRGVYLYVFCGFGREYEPIGPVKIGITSNVCARLSSVQTGQHRRMFVLAIFNTPNREIARAREAEWHQRFKEHRLEGEWFDLNPVDALEAMCAGWRHYFQDVPDLIETIGVPEFERDVKAYRAWREYYAENSNVRVLS